MPDVQTVCCRCESRYLCACPQGFRSHAMPDEHLDDQECECSKIKMTAEAWKNCSGQTHVFHPGDAKCGCGERFAGAERV